MDDFERAIVISFDQTGSVDAGLKGQAIAYCEQFKQSPTLIQACLQKLQSSQYGEVQFWCLQALEGIIKQRYASLRSQERILIRSSLMEVVCTDNQQQRPAFIKNKLAQVIVLLICIEYPSEWPMVFLELVSNLPKGPAVVDMFCRILNSLDEEVISLEFPRKADEIALATRLKDAMRQQCIAQIVGAWYNLVLVYKNGPKPELAAGVLETMARFITWIDIGMVANESFMPLLFEILVSSQESIQLRGAAADCLLAIVSKGMDASAKLTLLQQLRLGSICSRMRDLDDVQFAAKFSGLLTRYAAEVLECSKKVDNGVSNVSSMLDEVLPSVFYFVQHDDEEISASTLQFLSNYVNRMKVGRSLTEQEAGHIGHILEVIRYRMRYNPDYRDALDVLDRDGKEEEERVEGYRKELFMLFKSISRVAPDVTKSFVKNVVAAILGSPDSTSFEEVEAGITLVYKLGEGMPEDALKASTGYIQEMLAALLTVNLPCTSHRLVALSFLETVVRYVKFFQHNQAYIPAALAPFLDARGIHHPNPHVSSRAIYLFVRLVKALRPQLVPYVDCILQSLPDTLSVSSKKIAAKDSVDQRSYLFEAIGLLIGTEEVPKDKQESFLSAVFAPLYNQVDAALGNRTDGTVNTLLQIILALTYLSKGFTEQLLVENRPALGNIFRQSVDVVLRILVAYPEADVLRSKVISFLHRMVEVLGTSVFPFLPTAIRQLLSQSEPKDLVEFLQLLNQLINKFTLRMSTILQEIFPSVMDRSFVLLPKGALPQVTLSNTEEFRELQELQKILLSLLHAIVSCGLSDVLLYQSSERLNDIFQLLLSCACDHKDILARKVSVQVLSELASQWCGNATVREKVPGFDRFMIDRFAADCCIRSTLVHSFNLNDAQTAALLMDIASAQQVLFQRCGEEFLVQMGTAILPALRCPPNLAEEYCLHIQRKSLKTFFRSFTEQMRAVQYGNGQR